MTTRHFDPDCPEGDACDCPGEVRVQEVEPCPMAPYDSVPYMMEDTPEEFQRVRALAWPAARPTPHEALSDVLTGIAIAELPDEDVPQAILDGLQERSFEVVFWKVKCLRDLACPGDGRYAPPGRGHTCG